MRDSQNSKNNCKATSNYLENTNKSTLTYKNCSEKEEIAFLKLHNSSIKDSSYAWTELDTNTKRWVTVNKYQDDKTMNMFGWKSQLDVCEDQDENEIKRGDENTEFWKLMENRKFGLGDSNCRITDHSQSTDNCSQQEKKTLSKLQKQTNKYCSSWSLQFDQNILLSTCKQKDVLKPLQSLGWKSEMVRCISKKLT